MREKFRVLEREATKATRSTADEVIGHEEHNAGELDGGEREREEEVQ